MSDILNARLPEPMDAAAADAGARRFRSGMEALAETLDLRATLREILGILNAAEEARAGVRPHEMAMNMRRWRQTLARSDGFKP